MSKRVNRTVFARRHDEAIYRMCAASLKRPFWLIWCILLRPKEPRNEVTRKEQNKEYRKEKIDCVSQSEGAYPSSLSGAEVNTIN